MATKYPLPVFHFRVEWGGSSINFSEVSGLNVETQVIEYRDGASPDFSSVKMPGLQKYGNITLKRGAMQGDNEFFDWWNTHQLNTIERRDVIISLLNEKHEPVITWRVRNAFPVKVDGGSLKATGNEVSIETLEIAHEGITVER
ncbi:MAG TPA: phage tail protein [Bacteroidales bacterium]|mgnify:FL=1|nr:phage tail protein [Bacteroidales bacterium]HOH84150.1 phage tail protein [Bacteroidales bacterium]HPB24307.1 phage tail protein [Bacteroidales bacterium]HPI28972.1 phage tail protein [Bacteroidales bacterium]HQN16379.1 phage tail protein [Bacteroidales bacterium]